MHKYSDLSFFLTKRIREVVEEELAQVKDLERFSSIHLLTSLSSESDIKYIWPKRGLELSINSIA